ncbi:hypothetical protein [Thalassotalea sp. Y01]|uniref:hypothetical protein n=1 Tax=Thalassotalea sp. Y01 TaxID=2729613 RepID=UPI00145F48CF|nr:hypothetical protein [Thalassotalea sp. Y01]NMP16135.1 hypothetical protein [Thalassotalea sp. Y01]
MFKFPFTGSTQLNKVEKAFERLDEQWDMAQKRLGEISQERLQIEAFIADPFVEIVELEKKLVEQNTSFIPDMDLDTKKDDIHQFSISYNDLMLSFGGAASTLSYAGWLRAYKEQVQNSNKIEMFKAYYRIKNSFFGQRERESLIWHGVTFWEDYLTLIGKNSLVKQWKENLKALTYMKDCREEHIRKHRLDQHQKAQSAHNVDFSRSTFASIENG